MKEHGYGLRNYLTLHKYAEVIRKVLSRRKVESGFVWPGQEPKVLTIASGSTRLLNLQRAPIRVSLGNVEIAEYDILTPRKIVLRGNKLGETELRLWFADPEDFDAQQIVEFTVRVVSAR